MAVLRALRGTPQNGPDFKALRRVEVEKYGSSAALRNYKKYWDAVFACYYEYEKKWDKESEKEAFLVARLEAIDKHFGQNLD